MADLTGMMQAAAGSAGGGLLVQDVFSVDLYTGNGATQTITNDLDLSGEGGLVWLKSRTTSSNNYVFDTNRGALQAIYTDSSLASGSVPNTLTAFNSDGFALGSQGDVNGSSIPYVSWAFRKAEKFFDIVTYTGTSSTPRSVAHNLGSTPGFVIMKRTDTGADWHCWHRSQVNGFFYLNATNAATNTGVQYFTASDTEFTFNSGSVWNTSGGTYVMYLFAHDAGGFGGGSANVITCGSFTTDGSGSASVTLGYEPQWMLGKRTDDAGQWFIFDTTRTWAPTNTRYLQPNNSNAEGNYGATDVGSPNATGFTIANFGSSQTYIYIAIRANM
jgi:hypothetical protein